MINRETALTILRLSTNADRSEIISAYNRLARRYPLQQFPERHTRLLQAKTMLLNPETAFKAILMEETIDLSWLNRYSTPAPDHDETVPDDLLTTPKQCLGALFRPHLKKGENFFPPSIGVEDEIENMLSCQLAH